MKNQVKIVAVGGASASGMRRLPETCKNVLRKHEVNRWCCTFINYHFRKVDICTKFASKSGAQHPFFHFEARPIF
jgi:hypothetical protein